MLHRKITILLFILLLLPFSCQSTTAADWSSPGEVNKIVTEFRTPQIAPGSEGHFSFLLTNPFDVEIKNISVLAEPYLFVHQDGTAEWGSLTHLPIMKGSSSSSGTDSISHLLPNEYQTISWQITTFPDTPHDSWPSQPIYLVRLLITFDDGTMNVSYASRGFFSDDEWTKLRSTGDLSVGGVNLTYLLSLGYNGIIPETSFEVKENIPLWPVLVMAAVAILCFIYGTYLYSIRRPGTANVIFYMVSRIKSILEDLVGRIRKR